MICFASGFADRGPGRFFEIAVLGFLGRHLEGCLDLRPSQTVSLVDATGKCREAVEVGGVRARDDFELLSERLDLPLSGFEMSVRLDRSQRPRRREVEAHDRGL